MIVQRSIAAGPGLGITCMLVGGIFMSLNNATLKLLSEGYPIGEIAFIRSIFVWLPLYIFISRAGGVAKLRILSYGGHLVRGLCLVGSLFLYILAVRHLPLADVTAITFSTPLYVTAMAPFLLKEPVGWRRWSAVIFGFAGVVVIVRPGETAFALIALVPVVSSFFSALQDVVTRRMMRTESADAVLSTTTAIVMIAGLATLPFGWLVPTWFDFGLMAVSGLITGISHRLVIEAFRQAEAVVISPFRYVTIIWAILLGYAIWGDLPDLWVLLGVAMVIASGIYIFHREIVLRTRERKATER